MNNKGFMMAEVIVVASIILLAFSFFYINYNGLISEYNKRITYYDIGTLYELANYRDQSTTNYTMSAEQIEAGYKLMNKDTTKCIYLVKYNRIMFLANNASGLNKTFVGFLTYIAGKINFEYNDYVLVMEKCNSDKTDCKYAYLEMVVK